MKLKYKILGIEIISIATFMIVLLLSTTMLSFATSNLPPEYFNQTFLKSQSASDLSQINDEISGYFVQYIALIIFILSAGIFIYNYSRGLIWGLITKKMLSLKEFKKYFLFNTFITLIIFTGSVSIFFLIQSFIRLIPFLMQYLASELQQVITTVIPLVILYYISTNLIYNFNYNYLKYGYKHVFKNFKYQIKPSLYALVGIWVFNWALLVLLRPGSTSANLIGSIAFLAHITYLKFSVKQFYENE